jgi:hypothetical protein
MRAVDGDDPVLRPVPLDDRHRTRLDHEEVTVGVARGKQNLAGLDAADAPQAPQARPLLIVQTREGPVAVHRLGKPGTDRLFLADKLSGPDRG